MFRSEHYYYPHSLLYLCYRNLKTAKLLKLGVNYSLYHMEFSYAQPDTSSRPSLNQSPALWPIKTHRDDMDTQECAIQSAPNK